MAEVVLIFPKFSNWNYKRDLPTSDTIPMGLLSIGSVLEKAGFSVRIIDGNLSPDYLQAVKTEVRDTGVLFIGISVMTAQVPEAMAIAAFCRLERPELPIVWGGIHPTLFPEQTNQDKNVDLVIFGEGEGPVLELARRLKEKKDFKDIPGLAWKQDEKIKVNDPGQPTDLDALPLPDYGLLAAERYARLEIKGQVKRSLAVHSGIGCPHRCSFCINTLLFKRKRRSKSAARILAEIQYLIKQYQVNHISFRDENFFSSRAEVEKFLAGVKESGLKFTWDTTVRADYFQPSYLSEEMLERLREAGCIRLGIGVESASARILEILRKDITLQEVEASAVLCRRHGIHPYYSFMIALPGEQKKEMLETINFIVRLKKINPDADIITPQIYRPYPGNELYEYCLKSGFQEPADLEGWAKMNLESSGYIPGRELPWISDLRLINSLTFFVEYAVKAKIPGGWQAPFYLALRLSFWLRRKVGFWHLLFEQPLYEILTSCKRKKVT